ncbi:MAG: thiamine pyrophosphate-dependent enzyme [Candidatus Neomarinimicrobiota bacterium]
MADLPLESFIVKETLPYEFCPGCSHGKVLEALDKSLQQQGLDPSEIVLVTDIGCVGLSDKYFKTHAFHGLHGRSITYGSGIKMQNPDLSVVVLIGDGGCGIGGHHLLNAARINTNITVLVFNNFNFGMTGGQHSVTTPPGSITSTTALGSLDAPMDIAGTARVNGAGFAARATAYDKDLPDLITKAMNHDGFSILDIWELCTAYYVVKNDFGRKEMVNSMETLGFSTGILQETDRPGFQTSYKKLQIESSKQKRLGPRIFKTRFSASLDHTVSIVLAGAAGQKVVSAGNLLSAAAALSGLYTSSRADFPITIQTGFSVAELIISPQPILDSSIQKPDIVVLLAPEGRTKISRILHNMDKRDRIFFAEGLGDVNCAAEKKPLVFPETAKKFVRKNLSALSAGYLCREMNWFPFEALLAAVKEIQKPKIAELNLEILSVFK